MRLAVRTCIGPYEILAPIGAGGMGEVYRAKDSKLDREVAIKVLSGTVAQDRERLARFEREAKVLASLNHPNIAQIYGLEESGDTRALVMELVRGDTLKTPQPLANALNYARQIAEALEAAHDKSITHRDLKPANIMITRDAVVKVLDFGLASVPIRQDTSDAENSPTMTMAATQAGMIMGTAAYMSPEQAAGKVADRRSDIWSFGVVLYEMLTGERLFDGETVSHTLAEVLRADIDFNRLPPSTPEQIRNLLMRCLDRDIKMRLQSIAEARIAIQKYMANPSGSKAVAGAPPRRGPQWIWPIVSSALAALLLVAAVLYWRAAAPAYGAVRLSFTPPPEVSFNDLRSDEVVLSPDGRKIAFTGRDRDGHTLLWVRSLDSSQAKALPGTDDPVMPFWSPDSRSLGLGSRGKLKRVELAGGPTVDLSDAPRLTGGTWNSEGTILFGPDYGSTVYQIPAKGGTAASASLRGSGGEGGWSPSFLPDGKHFLFHMSGPGVHWAGRSETPIMIGVLGSMQTKVLVKEAGDVQYAPSGWLLLVSRGSLLAQRFDADRQELKGDPLPVLTLAADVRFGPGTGHMFSVSNNGMLLWRGAWSRDYQLVWRDRKGRQVGSLGTVVKQTDDGQEPRLSPDGKQAAVRRNNSVWVTDVWQDVPLKLMSGQMPIWSPDGRRVALNSAGLFVIAANGVGEAEKLEEGVRIPNDWSPDGRFVVFQQRAEKTRNDLWALPLFGERHAYPLLSSPGDDVLARFSPDGAWLAYTSDESGSEEVYVRSFTRDGHIGGDRKRISSNGGFQPIWRRDGKELFYLSLKDEMMSVVVNRSGGAIEFGVPQILFKTRTLTAGRILGTYDVAPDGRFLIGELLGESGAAAPTVVLNWPATLKRPSD